MITLIPVSNLHRTNDLNDLTNKDIRLILTIKDNTFKVDILQCLTCQKKEKKLNLEVW